jgi:hypothetical protein
VIVRAEEHVTALRKVVLGAVTDREPCRATTRRPPSAAARAEAERIRRARAGDPATGDPATGDVDAGEQVVIDFADYARAARPLRGQPGDQPGDEAGER